MTAPFMITKSEPDERGHWGLLALLKGEGEGEAWASASRFEQRCEVTFVGSKTPHLGPLPFSKGRGDRRGTICCALRSLQGQAA
jgi:hypothetical protein